MESQAPAESGSGKEGVGVGVESPEQVASQEARFDGDVNREHNPSDWCILFWCFDIGLGGGRRISWPIQSGTSNRSIPVDFWDLVSN